MTSSVPRPTACSRPLTRMPAPATPNDGRHLADPVATGAGARGGLRVAAADALESQCRRHRPRRRCRSPIRTSICAPGRVAAIRSSSSLGATSGSRSCCAGPTGSRCVRPSGQEGWVNRSQLETTLTEAGTAKAFRDVLLDDYLRRKLELGAAWGMFDSEPMLKVWTAYRFADALSIEATIGQVQGTFSGTEFWNINLNVEPWSDQRFSPFFGVGLGPLQEHPEREPRQCGRHQCQPGQCGDRAALLHRRTLRGEARLLDLHSLRLGQRQR